jgi:hypothetical protein
MQQRTPPPGPADKRKRPALPPWLSHPRFREWLTAASWRQWSPDRRTRQRWRVRAVLWLAAGAAGLAVVGFATLAERSLALFDTLYRLA